MSQDSTNQANIPTPLPPIVPTSLTPSTVTPATMAFHFGHSLDEVDSDKILEHAERIEHEAKRVPSINGIPILSKLGQGGMGAVYRGYHPQLKKEVAIKILPRDPMTPVAEFKALRDRFIREAQLASAIQSPNLISIHDISTDKKTQLDYMALELIVGMAADKCIEQVRFTGALGLREADALDVCIAACVGLAAAHAAGVKHRDIKPGNILIPFIKGSQTELHFSNAKLADLGLARSNTDEIGITLSNVAMGSPGYMAPEQYENARDVEPTADIFSMGATLYAFLAGRSPFDTAGLKGQARHAHIYHETMLCRFIPIHIVRTDVTELTARTIAKCLRKQNRFADGTELLTELRKCREWLYVKPPPDPGSVAVPDQQKEAENSYHVREMRMALSIAIPEAQEAKANGDWNSILEHLEALCAEPANKDHPSKRIADRLLNEARQKAEEAERLRQEKAAAAQREALKWQQQEAERLAAIARTHEIPKELSLDLGANVKMEFVYVRPGEFQMGSMESERGAIDAEKPAHRIRITRGYYIGKYPVTLGQFKRFVAAKKYETDAETQGCGYAYVKNKWEIHHGMNWKKPGFPQDDEHPIVLVSWHDTHEFLTWISAATRKKLILPSEAQWEYSARGVESRRYPWGDVFDLNKCNHQNVNKGTTRVGKYPNESWCGAFDLAGNVWEWCQDAWDEKAYSKDRSDDPLVDHANARTRVLRGGSWSYQTANCRSAFRHSFSPSFRLSSGGFRCALLAAD